MKLRLVTLAALATLAGHALAVPNTTPVTAAEAAAATDAVYMSGSSAAKAIISGLVAQNCTGWVLGGAAGSFVTFSDASGQYNAYSCRVAAVNDWGLPENTVVTVNKRDDQGSGFGVFPVAYNTSIAFLNLAGTPVSGKYPLANHTADVGISDVEPVLFNASANRPGAFAASAPVKTTSFGSQTTVFSQVFGVAVTAKLYTALQTAQGTAGVPSLSRDYLANLFSQNAGAVGYLPLGVANADAGVNVCYRDQGSGTRVATNVFLGQFPGNTTASFAPLDGSVATTASPSDAVGDVYVDQAGSGGGVQTCLKNVNALTIGYGVGVLGFGTAEVPADYKYVAIDGTVPSRNSAKTGNYGFWVESTIQTNKLSTASAAAKAWLNKFIAKAGQSTNLNQLTTAAQNGVFALPLATSDAAFPADDCSVYAGTYAGTTAADKFCGRYSRNGDNRTVAVFFK